MTNKIKQNKKIVNKNINQTAKEASQRILAAIKNSNIKMPQI
jgi:hypothetical protein